MISNYKLLKKEIASVSRKYEPILAKTGLYTLKACVEGDFFLFHSAYDPVKEGGNFAACLHGYIGKIVVYGLGMGYHTKPLIDTLAPGCELHIFEYDLSVVRAAFELTDIESYLHKENVFFHWPENHDSFFSELAIAVAGCERYAVHKPSARLVPKLEAEVLSHASQIPVCDKNEIIIYNGASSYGVLNDFERSLADSFNKLGLSVRSINISDKYYGLETLFRIKNAKFILSFCVAGLLENAGELCSLFDAAAVPFVFLSVDDPVFQIVRPHVTARKTIYTWVDRTMPGVYERFAPYFPGVANAFLPHGCESVEDIERLFNKTRNLDVVVSGTISGRYKFDALLSDVEQNDRDAVAGATQQLLAHPEMTITESFEHFLTECGEAYPDEYLLTLLKKYGRAVYLFIAANRRFSAVKAVLDAGVSVTCSGRGWEATGFERYENFNYIGEVHYRRQLEVFEDAKIVLNTMPLRPDGSHERIFQSMARGALCVTDYSKYLDEILINGEQIVFYDMRSLHELPVIVNKYLEDEGLRERVARNGYDKAIAAHTWFHRAQELLRIVENN